MLESLVISGLSIAGLITLWRDGSVFATARAWVDAKPGIRQELLSCDLCLSFHIAAWFALVAWAFAGFSLTTGYIPNMLAIGMLAFLVRRAVQN